MRVERILAIFLALGLIVSSFILFDRMKVENGYKTYEITLDYNEMLRYSSEAEQDMEKSGKFMNMCIKILIIQVI